MNTPLTVRPPYSALDNYDPSRPTKFGWKITPAMDWEAERLQFTTEIDGICKQIHNESICFKDKAVRTALIALGWTPPPEARASHTSP